MNVLIDYLIEKTMKTFGVICLLKVLNLTKQMDTLNVINVKNLSSEINLE